MDVRVWPVGTTINTVMTHFLFTNWCTKQLL